MSYQEDAGRRCLRALDSDRMKPGDRVRFENDSKWWDVRCGDGRYTILTRQADFRPKGLRYYTIIDAERELRGPCNLIGQGWDEHMEQDACDSLLEALEKGEVEVSYRNNVPVLVADHRCHGQPQ